MMNFMFILMVLMALMMAWWLVPIAFVIWLIVKNWDTITGVDWNKVFNIKDEKEDVIHL